DPDLLRRRVAARLRLLGLGDGGAAALVEREQALRLRRQAAARERLVERVGIVANCLDVVHGRRPKTRLKTWMAGTCPAMRVKNDGRLFYAVAAHSAGLLAEPAEAPEDEDFARFSANRTEMIEPS